MDDIYSGVGILRRRDLDPEFSEREYLLDARDIYDFLDARDIYDFLDARDIYDLLDARDFYDDLEGRAFPG